MRRPTSALASAFLGTALAASTVLAQQSSPYSSGSSSSPGGAGAPVGNVGSVPGVAAAPRAPRPLLRNGWDYIAYQEYDRALTFFREAELRKKELTPTEQLKLTQGIERAQRGIREASVGMKNEQSYARSGRVKAPGALALASPGAAQAKTRDTIQLAGGEDAAPPDANAANVRASLPGNDPGPPGPAILPSGPELPPITISDPGAPPTAAAAASLDLTPTPASAPIPSIMPEPDPKPTPAATTPPTSEEGALPKLPNDLVHDAALPPETAPPATAAPAATAPPAVAPPEVEKLPSLPEVIVVPPASEPMPPAAAPQPPATPLPEADKLPSLPDMPTRTDPATAPAPMPAPAPATSPDVPPIMPDPAPATPTVTPSPSSLPDAPPAPEAVPAPGVSSPAMPSPASPVGPPPLTRNADTLIPYRAEAPPSTLTPELQREVEKIAQKQDEDMKKNPFMQTTPPVDINDPSGTGTIDTSKLVISRAPSPTEARPIRAIPVPEEFVPLPKREWDPNRKYWAAAATCHFPLYFQDAALERYGYSMEQRFGHAGRFLSYPIDDIKQSKQRNQLVQPFFSAGLFAAQIVLLPYNMLMDPPWESEYDLGYYRPGDRVPTDVIYLPIHGVGPPGAANNYGAPATKPRW